MLEEKYGVTTEEYYATVPTGHTAPAARSAEDGPQHEAADAGGDGDEDTMEIAEGAETHAADAVASGAKFVVSPILDEEVVAEVNGPLRSVMIPGCATPSECWRAHKLGCRFQKVFG